VSEVVLEALAKTYAGGQTIGPVSLSVVQGEMLALLGPSGCGKTTVLRMIAGFVAPTAGAIRLRGADVTRVPAHRRNAALVFQNFALFPHLNVFDNIAFGLRRRRVPRADIVRRVDRLIGMMRLDGLADRRPVALSGGQQQRVALARALAIEPAVILLDEPFSSLDTQLRESTRFELRALQQEIGFTAILVTHDQGEALSICDRVAILNAGRLEQIGSAQEVYYRPATPFIAGFVGKANHVASGILRPESILIVEDPSRNAITATVSAAAFLGATSEIEVRLSDGATLILIADGQAPARYPVGSPIRLTWPPEAVVSFGESR
jgi:ABC-type Fe3+/spermidine/putrescine transport system ATPase subunit